MRKVAHGGARKGAGRPRKWQFADILKIGQACESAWRAAEDRAANERLNGLRHAAEIAALQMAAQSIPVEQRKAWLSGDGYEDHHDDIEALLHDRHDTLFDEEAGQFAGAANRTASVSRKPPRGTRKSIIAKTAKQFDLDPKAVDNLWQAYRRFERETRPPMIDES